jgi:phosphoribosylaminoimidazole-succinocarboxamide synthase
LQYIDEFIDAGRDHVLRKAVIDTTKLPHFERLYEGKVRDMYICRDYVILITTDRQSAFDRQLAEVPYKGRVLNIISNWWFQQTQNIVPNYIVSVPHPNVTIGRRCDVFPVEFVMRAYITGSTSTSLWTNYAKGVRDYCGHRIPEGLRKNQRLQMALLTPTTKSDEHDELISAEEIVQSGLMSLEDWETCATYAHRLFAYGQQKAAENGLILVDTKVSHCHV